MGTTPTVTIEHRLFEQPAGLLERADPDGWMVVHCVLADQDKVLERLRMGAIPHLAIVQTRTSLYSRGRKRQIVNHVPRGHVFARWPQGHRDLYGRLAPAARLTITPVPAGNASRFLPELRGFMQALSRDPQGPDDVERRLLASVAQALVGAASGSGG